MIPTGILIQTFWSTCCYPRILKAKVDIIPYKLILILDVFDYDCV